MGGAGVQSTMAGVLPTIQQGHRLSVPHRQHQGQCWPKGAYSTHDLSGVSMFYEKVLFFSELSTLLISQGRSLHMGLGF
jgi:hypothetical protein